MCTAEKTIPGSMTPPVNQTRIGNIVFYDSAGRVVGIENQYGEIGPQILQFLFSRNTRRGIQILDTTFSATIRDVMEGIVSWEKQSGDFLVTASAADFLFSMFTPFWNEARKAGQYSVAKGIWLELTVLARDLEKQLQGRVHQGTPYYFLGVTYLDQLDIDAALRLLHLAVEEDKKISTAAGTPKGFVNAPAYKTVSLRDDRDNYLYDFIRLLRGKLEGYLQNSNQRLSRSLSIQAFDTGFLQNPDLDEETFGLAYFLTWTEKWSVLNASIPESDGFSPLARLRMCFTLTGITETLLRTQGGVKMFAPNLYAVYAKETGLAIDQAKKIVDSWAAQFGDWKADFGKTLKAALDWHPGDLGPLQDPRWHALTVAWQLRNHGAHQLEAPSILSTRASDIDSVLLSALFLAFEGP